MKIRCSKCGTINNNDKICKGCMSSLENELVVENIESIQTNNRNLNDKKQEFIKPLIKYILLYILNVILVGWLSSIVIGIIEIFFLKLSLNSNLILSIVTFVFTIIEEFIIVYITTHSGFKKYNIDRKKFNIGIIIFYIIMCIPTKISEINILTTIISNLVVHGLSFIFVNYFLFNNNIDVLNDIDIDNQNNIINKKPYFLILLGVGIIILSAIFIFRIATDDSYDKKVYYEDDQTDIVDENVDIEENDNMEEGSQITEVTNTQVLKCQSIQKSNTDYIKGNKITNLSSFKYNIWVIDSVFNSYEYISSKKYDNQYFYQLAKNEMINNGINDDIKYDNQNLIIDEYAGTDYGGTTGIENAIRELNIDEVKSIIESDQSTKVSCYIE